MSDDIKYKLECKHITRDIKEFGQCPNCDMHILLNLHEFTLSRSIKKDAQIAKLEAENKELRQFIYRFHEEYYLKNSTSGLSKLFSDTVEWDSKQENKE